MTGGKKMKVKSKDNKLLSFRTNSKWKKIHDEIGIDEYLLMFLESKEFMNVDWNCSDCGTDIFYNDFYMVDENIWKQFGNEDGFLCIGCLKKRMGFKLKKLHFPKNSLNWEFFEILRLTKGIKIKRAMTKQATFSISRNILICRC